MPIHVSFIVIMHVRGNIYPTNLKKITVLQKKLIRIVTCSPYRAHSKPLLVANNVLSVSEINVYMVGIFIYNYCNDNMPDIFNGFFQRNSERHIRNTRQSNDFHVRFARLDVRKFSLRIHGATIWNDIPLYIKKMQVLWMYPSKCSENILLLWIAWVCDTIPIDVADYWMTVLSFSEEYHM